MAIHVSDRQLARIDDGRALALIVRCERTKKKYAVITQNRYEQIRPVLQWCAAKADGSREGTAKVRTDVRELILAGLKLQAAPKANR